MAFAEPLCWPISAVVRGLSTASLRTIGVSKLRPPRRTEETTLLKPTTVHQEFCVNRVLVEPAGVREQADRVTSFAGRSPQSSGAVPSNEDPRHSQILAHRIAGLQECETTRPRSTNWGAIQTVIGLSGLTGAILANPWECFQGEDTEIR